mmetsp:Transcript_2526/g.1797  ORF Transcript_2526/g.1797 Transcript_2526/m.1797 type:complete len:100 (+) Transcript_2526:348-647(+)|eukprot:CAMPEP_0202956500 /NCGR_PEP_ID=MMETSP1396-20130829/1005_1 /ASSEMBLY_ACC=CAM_ASM_000872 /TAXON_ID= /ORGANISM="Pseudokeronopsis sp., Strain Brazil" /LENGTH=99 /DNA_ID=CAMNT_0049673551 /DNA_START=314 /DNA_END=613 /DNA_ORIENTATION=+
MDDLLALIFELEEYCGFRKWMSDMYAQLENSVAHTSLNPLALIENLQKKSAELFFEFASIMTTVEVLWWQGYTFEIYLQFTEAVGHFLGTLIADMILIV